MKKRKNFSRLVTVILAVAALLSLLAGCGGPERATRETEQITRGIDVARFQGIIDWQQVASSGVDFAMIRLGYRSNDQGEIVLDSTARYNLQEAAKAGIPIGAYFFSTAISQEEAVAEAQWAAEIIAKYPITYPVVYDCEGFQEPDSRQFGMTKKQRTDNALAFLKTIEELGYEGMFYASKNELWEEQHWETSRIEKKYKIWVAQYPEIPYPQTPESSYYGDHQMWQYSTEGQIPGINQNVDLNVAYFGYDGIEPPKDSVPPEEVAPDVEALMNFEDTNEEVTAKEETNLRSSPSQGADSRVLYTLKNGQVAQRIGISDSGWSKLTYDGYTCYAVTSYLTTDKNYTPNGSRPKDDDGIQTVFNDAKYKVTAKDVVNLRSIPSVTSEEAQVVGQLKNGDYVDCIGTSENGWSKLSVEGKICYAVSSYLMQLEKVEAPEEEGIRTMFEEISDQVTAKKEVNLRNIPSTTRKDAEVVLKLKNGDIMHRTGINRDLGWSRVEIDGQTLYCVTSLLEKAN